MRWSKGQESVERLLDAGHLQRIPIDDAAVQAVLIVAKRHIKSAQTCWLSDPEGSLALAYDGARKAAGALLAHQGLRATTRGGHITVVETVTAQFPGVGGLRSLDRLRRRRNEAEYPDPARYAAVNAEEAGEAIDAAQQAIAAVERLLEAPQLGVF
jgi:hypothetical protein